MTSYSGVNTLGVVLKKTHQTVIRGTLNRKEAEDYWFIFLKLQAKFRSNSKDLKTFDVKTTTNNVPSVRSEIHIADAERKQYFWC